jgi:hypothetical protein
MHAPRIIGYGICGPGEAARFMRDTLNEFNRLCDETLILVNCPPGADVNPEIALIEEFGFHWTSDTREWGKLQWKIKQDFIETDIAALAREGDVMVCLDMDERFDRHLTKDWLRSMPFDAYKVFIVDLWNDEAHYKPESCFWNTRIWRWTGVTEWIAKPVHCGLAPRWAVAYNRYAPFILVHKGLMRKADRERKIARYEKYDPYAIHLGKPYYAMLHSDTAEPFDEEALHATIDAEVATYHQRRPTHLSIMSKPKGRFALVENPAGVTVDIPERQLEETLRRKGFTFIGWAGEAEQEIEDMFSEEAAETETPMSDSGPYDSIPHNRVGMYEREELRQEQKAAAEDSGDAPAKPAPKRSSKKAKK